MEVVGAQDVSNDAQDLSPLGAQRAFAKEAEDNVIERLFKAGLLDAPSDFDKTLEALANNILAYNNIAVSSPIHVRTLLTEPLESLAVGNTIILSKSLIDTTAVITADGAQQMGNLNALLAFQLAHIISGHKLDTKYAFNDRLLFPDDSSFKRIPMHHTQADNEEAAKKAVELLNAKELVDGQKYFGLYLQQLQQRIKALRTLNEPQIGDALIKGDNDLTFWMAALMPKAEKLNVKDLKQQAAEPLSAFLRFDPWTDQVVTLHTSFEPLLSPSDKMPFEVSPVYLKLSYYKPPVEAAPPAAAADPNAAPAATDPNAAPAAPAAADPNAAPAAPPAPAQPAATPPADRK
jgi:pyruvate/2-oxoglutarate dehydrogenase complex dihydrolipoamide acyltransferase (E2) component